MSVIVREEQTFRYNGRGSKRMDDNSSKRERIAELFLKLSQEQQVIFLNYLQEIQYKKEPAPTDREKAS